MDLQRVLGRGLARLVRPVAVLVGRPGQWDVRACRHEVTRPKQLADGRLAEVCWFCEGHSRGSEPLSPDPRHLEPR